MAWLFGGVAHETFAPASSTRSHIRTGLAVLLAVPLVAASGCARSAYVRTDRPVQGPATPPDTVPRGTLAMAQLHQPLSTSRSKQGDRFTAELIDPLVDSTGRELVGRGAIVEGVVRGTDRSSIGGDSASIDLQLTGVQMPEQGILQAPLEVASAPLAVGSSFTPSLLAGLAGAAAGAGTGVAIDRDQAGLVLGSTVIGAGVGALVGYFFGGRDAELPAGSVLTLRVTDPMKVPNPIASNRTYVPTKPAKQAAVPAEAEASVPAGAGAAEPAATPTP